jgi:hypothetical protein
MHGQLVTKKIKVNPCSGAATLAAAQHATIKLARLVQVGDIEGEVKKTLHGLQDSRPKLQEITPLL